MASEGLDAELEKLEASALELHMAFDQAMQVYAATEGKTRVKLDRATLRIILAFAVEALRKRRAEDAQSATNPEAN